MDLRASTSESTLSREVVVTRASFTPPSRAASTVSTTPGRGSTSPAASSSWKICDLVAWIAAASTSSPRDSAYAATRSWPPLVASIST